MFDKTFKAKVQVWVLKYQIPIYSVFQLMLITTVGIIYPGVETHSLCMGGAFGLNLIIICYLLYLLEIPVLAMAGISLLVFKILNFLYSESFLYGVLLCFGIAGFVIVIQILKKVPPLCKG
jgi:hypothetical protein